MIDLVLTDNYEDEFYYLEIEEDISGFNFIENSLLEIKIILSNDQVNHQRAIYNFLDFLGDVGGLLDALKVIAWSLVSLVSQGSISAHLVSKIFFTR